METMETLETSKRYFFTELYGLDVSDDTLNDVDNVLANLRAAKPVRKAPTSSQTFNSRRANCTQRQFPVLGRTVSAPTGLISEKAKLPRAEPLPHDGEIQPDAAAAPVLRPPVTEGLELHSPTAAGRQNLRAPAQVAPNAKGKRKRGPSREVLPEAQQIFRGLKFCKLSFLSRPPFPMVLIPCQTSYPTMTWLLHESFGLPRYSREVQHGSSSGTTTLPISSSTGA